MYVHVHGLYASSSSLYVRGSLSRTHGMDDFVSLGTRSYTVSESKEQRIIYHCSVYTCIPSVKATPTKTTLKSGPVYLSYM